MTLTALLLVGGLSRRMGTDKATLQFAGEPLWSRQLRLLARLNSDVLWLSARSQPSWSPAQLEVILDQPPSRGPLSGLVAALSSLRTSHLLVLGIDMPHISLELLRDLWNLAQPGCGVVPLQGTRFEPVCAVYPREAVAVAQAAISQGRSSLQWLCQELLLQKRICTYPVPPEQVGLFQNLNTPDDLSGHGSMIERNSGR